MMKYQVIYLKPKKKKYAQHVATFYSIEDATLWEKHVRQQGCIESEIIPVL